ncbi:MAG TPA: DUF2283 domain-containing protein [Thermoleophilaceae bacterium]|jgi:uncharacterized protein YuzE|nr:DUF2283 domain-containing protein [Thermoleophilaceae bacterium]
MAEISVTVDEAGRARVNLTGSSMVEVRHSVDLSELEATETVPALESIVLQFDHYGRLAGIEVTDAADSVLPPGLLDGARAPP